MSGNLKFNLIFRVPEADICIKNSDVDFVYYKSSEISANYANFILWNLDEISYRELFHKSFWVNVFSQYSDEPEIPVFSGYIDLKSVERKMYEFSPDYDDVPTPDMFTKFRLIDSKNIYEDLVVNKDYREPISSMQIIEDCTDLIGVDNVVITADIPNKTYNKFKALGHPHKVIYEICKSLKVPVSITDNVVYIGYPDENLADGTIQNFNYTNSLEPQYQGNNEALIITDFCPQVNPNNFVKCEFEKMQGLFPVKSIYSVGNTYRTLCTSKIRIGV